MQLILDGHIKARIDSINKVSLIVFDLKVLNKNKKLIYTLILKKNMLKSLGCILDFEYTSSFSSYIKFEFNIETIIISLNGAHIYLFRML